MKIISFDKTLDAFLEDRKSVTRRQWSDAYVKTVKVGEIMAAWSKSPRHGGKRIGEIRVMKIYKQKLKYMPRADLKPEGVDCKTVKEFINKYFLGMDHITVTVVWFVRIR